PATAATMSPNARNSGAPGTPVPARRGPFTCGFGLGLGAGLSVVFEPRTTGREAAREVSTQQSASTTTGEMPSSSSTLVMGRLAGLFRAMVKAEKLSSTEVSLGDPTTSRGTRICQ